MKLLTLNTHAWHEEHQMDKIGQLARFINEHQFDVIALQEVNQSMHEAAVAAEGLARYTMAEQGAVIKQDNYAYVLLQQLEETYHWTWVPTHMTAGKYDEGMALLSRTPILETVSDYVSAGRDNANFRTRKIAGILTEAGGEKTWFVSGHFGWWHDSEEPFRQQWDRAEAVLQSCRSNPVFMMGDLNNAASVRGEGYDYIMQHGWYDLYEAAELRDEGYTVLKAIAGWANNTDSLRIDYILSSVQVRAKSSTVVLNGKTGPVVSDHFGVAAEL
ncbi:endonuclease/exonuclease/phosphatase family protein [Paenibacillus medicaginis]|uniref:Endonuclease/exonuclease/phosphatase family protein n=1 Tax=Paenibacillus medicaginis TaxID=1470560 RepID=A0ABV5C6R3_9BACL